MQRPAFPFALTFVLPLFIGLNAHADPITWNYSWSDSPAIVLADNHGTGGIALTAMPPGTITGNASIKATILGVFGSASPTSPDHYTNGDYSLKLHLTDAASNAKGDLTWTGAFNGTANINIANISNTYTSALVQHLTLGSHLYTVTIGPYIAPLTATNELGEIDASVVVTDASTGRPPPTQTPEPATLILASMGLACGGLMGRRKQSKQITHETA